MQRILILAAFLCSLNAQILYRWEVSSGGQIDTTSGFKGMTVGQTSQAHLVNASSDTATFGYWHKEWEPEICITINDSIWDVRNAEFPDTIPCHYTVDMLPEDRITINNCGNCAIDLGLRFVESSHDSVILAYYSGRNKGVLRAVFSEDELMPDYEPSDYIKDVISWSTYSVFGPSGFNMATYDELKLWFQMSTPMYTTIGDDPALDLTFTIELKAKFNMP